MLQTDSKTFFGHDKPYRRFGEGGPAWPIAAMAAMGCCGGSGSQPDCRMRRARSREGLVPFFACG